MARFQQVKITRYLGLGATYAGLSAPLFGIWEIAHLPLYTLWAEQWMAASLRAALHCTLGDIALAFTSIMIPLSGAWIGAYRATPLRVAVTTVLIGLALTGVIETVSVGWLQRWSYAPAMPIVPLIGIGLSPMLQWLIVPLAVFVILRRRIERLLRAAELPT